MYIVKTYKKYGYGTINKPLGGNVFPRKAMQPCHAITSTLYIASVGATWCGFNVNPARSTFIQFNNITAVKQCNHYSNTPFLCKGMSDIHNGNLMKIMRNIYVQNNL